MRRRRGGPLWPPARSLPGNVSPPPRRGGVCPSRHVSGMAVDRRRGGSLRPPARSPPVDVSPSIRRGGACPSRHVSGMAVDCRRGGSQPRPSSTDHDADRSCRLKGSRPAGRPPLPAAAKEAKRRRGRAPMGVPAHSRSTPGPLFTGDTPTPFRKISGTQNMAPGMIPSGPLGTGAAQNFGLCDFPAAPGSGQPWQRVQIGGALIGIPPKIENGRVRDPPLRGNFGHGRYNGRRSHRTDSVLL